MEFYIAQGISIVTALVAILSMQLKNMKSILIFQITANLLAASTYFLLGGFSGAGISLIAIIQLIVMFFYNKKNTKPPLIVIGIFIFLYVLYSILNFNTYLDLFPLLAALSFALGVAQTKPSIYRFYGLLNPLFWLVYDIFSGAYINVLMRIGIFTSALIAKIRLDGIFRKNKV